MQTRLESKFTSNITHDESLMLAEVLKHYDLNIEQVDKVRSAFKVFSDKGIFCLKRVSHGYVKAKKSFYIMMHLKERGSENIVDYYYTKDGKAFIKRKDAAFYLTYWIDGRETSFSSIDEILRCSELLSNFHNQAKGFEAPRHVKIKSHTSKWKKTFTKCRNELGKFKEFIDKLKLKAELDYTYRSSIDFFRKEAELAIRILDHSRYNELCDYYINERYVCHDSYYYQNILIDNDDRLFIVDLESSQYDIPVSDLGKFIRRILSKKKFRWDFDLCRKIIESYSKVRPMTKAEYEILLALLIFPHKFWKLGKKRYVKSKKWNEDKYRKKLRRLLREREYKREFIYCYINFYNLEIDYDPEIIEL
ncbi:MAG TPA: CotS family spore coat protein [Clostridia bacterium]|nr:CotS family spore coat protein [Clostridia bacterium]